MKNDDLQRGVLAFREHSLASLLNSISILGKALEYQNKIKQSLIENPTGDAYIEAYVEASKLRDQIQAMEIVAAGLQS
ncbi:MAG TPA: hypothetical protein VHV10_05075 [Ktedonobacteraceae bacterium]|nr:hypothetical protein [Ktedonobacteraceae bacterium]